MTPVDPADLTPAEQTALDVGLARLVTSLDPEHRPDERARP